MKLGYLFATDPQTSANALANGNPFAYSWEVLPLGEFIVSLIAIVGIYAFCFLMYFKIVSLLCIYHRWMYHCCWRYNLNVR